MPQQYKTILSNGQVGIFIGNIGEIEISTDKEQITADGEDTALVTAKIPPKLNADIAYVMIDGPLVTEEPIENGEIKIEVSSTNTGLIKVEVAAGGKQAYIILEAV